MVCGWRIGRLDGRMCLLDGAGAECVVLVLRAASFGDGAVGRGMRYPAFLIGFFAISCLVVCKKGFEC
jgi:hypothetical protein